MRIHLVNFRKHIDKTFVFRDKSLILLKGKNGAGKSTIFAAIFWCLYGCVKKIPNKKTNNSKTIVTIEFSDVYCSGGSLVEKSDNSSSKISNNKEKIIREDSGSDDESNSDRLRSDDESNSDRLRSDNDLGNKKRGIIVTRQRKPNLFKVTLSDGTELIDDAGQNKINELFGDKNVWESCCYVRQKSFNPLLTESNNTKLDLLNTLSFQYDNPQDYLVKINMELSDSNKLLGELQAVYSAEYKNYTQELDLTNINRKLYLPEDERQALEEKLKSYEADIAKLEKKVLENNLKSKEKEVLEANLKKAKKKFDQLEDVSLEKIPLLEKEYENLHRRKSIEPYLKQKQKYRQQLEKYTEEFREHQEKYSSTEKCPYTDDDYLRALMEKQKYEEMVNLCDKLKIEAKNEKIVSEISYLQKVLEMQPKLGALAEYEVLEKKYSEIVKKLDTISDNEKKLDEKKTDTTKIDKEIKSLRDIIDEQKRSLDVLLCPKCEQPVRVIQKKLVTADKTPSKPEHISENENSVTRLEKIKKLVIESEQIKDRMESINKHFKFGITDSESSEEEEKEGVRNKNVFGSLYDKKIERLDDAKMKKTKERLALLSKIQIVPEPKINPIIIKSKLDAEKQSKMYQQKILDLNDSLQKMPDVPDNDENSDSELSDEKTLLKLMADLKAKIKYIEATYNEKTSLTAQMKDYESQLKKISLNPKLEDEYLELKEKYRDSEKRITMSITIDKFDARKLELDKKKTQIDKMIIHISNVQTLKTISIEEECNFLQRTVDCINATLVDITSHLFDDPISIVLSLFKDEKKQGATPKQTVNLKIDYGGDKYDNITELSGGEGDRISLALTLAVSRLNPCPILLLDETLASLDGPIKETCLKALRKQLGKSKTIIVVQHDAIEGYYDVVQNIDKSD